jgi:hypothetical protein
MPAASKNWVLGVLLSLIVIGLVAGFTPISKRLLKEVNGSLAPTRYSSLALAHSSEVRKGLPVGNTIEAVLSNHTGRTTTYSWTATEERRLVGSGNQTLRNGQTITFGIGTRGLTNGEVRIALKHTKIFVTIPLTRRRS